MKAVTFYLIMFCDFKFILWINCEAELIREEKQKKTPQSAAFGIICIFLAGCGVNALSDNVTYSPTFAQVSRSPTVRLNTGFSAVEWRLSRQK
ncbi:hypothetical protein DL738_18195 [Escherichia coli]|nr:hypothetical protein [Escherichia coli]ORD44678.1 hypothetical protein A4T44_02580 [Escherichia coli]ORD61987.1 hypothetical protein A4T48_02595 [Escherichia coli]ORD90003.1 hypothetical protein A4T56_02580 [Escherichia coli]TXX20665.1 hypothetical protein D4M48_17375 [Escherichia coli]